MPIDLQNHPVVLKLAAQNPSWVTQVETFRNEVTIHIPPQTNLKIFEFLRDDPELCFRAITDLTAVDHYPSEPRFEVVYHLLSHKTGERLRLKARLEGENPVIASLAPVFPGVTAFECEVWDLFGIRFEGHPDLRRMLLPEDWEGHPLRKDYPTEGYR